MITYETLLAVSGVNVMAVMRPSAPTQPLTQRVVRRGMPIGGAVVDAPPDHATLLTVADPYDVIAPETSTAGDGRFGLSLAPGGATEIRIARERTIVRRPLPRIRSGLIDLGDIEWPSAIAVTLDYVGDERCALAALGPFGRSGISALDATIVLPGLRRVVVPEPGQWVITARCTGREWPVQPAMIDVPPDVDEWRAQIVVPP